MGKAVPGLPELVNTEQNPGGVVAARHVLGVISGRHHYASHRIIARVRQQRTPVKTCLLFIT